MAGDLISDPISDGSPNSVSRGGTGATSAGAAYSNIVGGCQTINLIGDSTAARSIYQPLDVMPSTMQAWTTGTVYAASECVQSNGFAFYTISGGTSGATPPNIGSLNDGGVSWVQLKATATKVGSDPLTWAEIFSMGRLRWDASQAYGGSFFGVTKAIIVKGGSGYTNPTLSTGNGVKGTVQMSGGVITGVTITSPGRFIGQPHTTIQDPTGTGCVYTFVGNSGGTWGNPGCLMVDIAAMVPDVVASKVDIVGVLPPFNELPQIGTTQTPASIIAGMKAIYDTICASGKKLIVIPYWPRITLTTAQEMGRKQYNRFARAYACGESWANTFQYKNVALADSVGVCTDGASTTDQPVGGNGGVAGAMTADGLHQSPRFAMYQGFDLWQAAQQFCAPANFYNPRNYSEFDPYDAALNPGGNMLEALPWAASTAVTIGQTRQNGTSPVRIYNCITAGTTASSGGPTSTSPDITDGTAHWAYAGPANTSVMRATAGSANTAAAGIVFTGLPAGGYQLTRSTGSASGTIIETVENPWATGQAGQRTKYAFSLGSGTATEIWQNQIFFTGGFIPTYKGYGLQPSDLGETPVYLEAEFDLSNVANMTNLSIAFSAGGSGTTANAGPNGTGVGNHILNSAGEMLAYPGNGRIFLRTHPIILPVGTTTLSLQWFCGFDASGGAGSATANVIPNYIGFRRANL